MNIFFKKIGMLILFFVMSILVLYFYGDYKKPSNPIKETTRTLFIGDSHIRLSINDSIIKGSQNLALSSEPIKFSYFKIHQVLEENKNINKIYLGFSYHSISSRVDDFILAKVIYFDNSSVYFPFLPWEEKKYLLTKHASDIIPYTQKLFEQSIFNFGFIKNKNKFSRYWGGFINEFEHSKVNLEQTRIRIINQYFQDSLVLDFSYENLIYLNKIIALCKEKKVELILVKTPLHRYYMSGVPEKFKIKFNDIIKKSGMPYVDFSQYDFSDSSFLPDGDHVSARGAAVVTKIISEMEQNAIR